SEDHVPGTSVGYTMQQILKAQFQHLRDGDFYFYLNDPWLPATMRSQVINTKFSDVIKRNTKLTSLQDNVFFIEECPGDEEEEKAVLTDSLSPVFERNETISQIRVYPNPANNTIHIDFGNWTGPVTVQVLGTGSQQLKKI